MASEIAECVRQKVQDIRKELESRDLTMADIGCKLDLLSYSVRTLEARLLKMEVQVTRIIELEEQVLKFQQISEKLDSGLDTLDVITDSIFAALHKKSSTEPTKRTVEINEQNTPTSSEDINTVDTRYVTMVTMTPPHHSERPKNLDKAPRKLMRSKSKSFSMDAKKITFDQETPDTTMDDIETPKTPETPKSMDCCDDNCDTPLKVMDDE